MNTMKLDGNGKGMALVLIMCKLIMERGEARKICMIRQSKYNNAMRIDAQTSQVVDIDQS